MGLHVRLRVGFRLFVVAAWTATLYVLRLSVLPLPIISTGADVRVRRFLFILWAKVVLAVARVRLRVRGAVPKGAFFSVSNHLSNLDLIIVASLTGCTFVARADIAQWPLLGFMVKTMNTIFIDRKRMRDTMRVNEMIGEAIDRGDAVHVFAESRISQDGQVHPFKPALLEPPVRKGIPVHYAALTYSTPEGWPPASEVMIWRSGVSFGRNVFDLLALPYIQAQVSFGDEPILGTERKELAEKLCEAVRGQFVPLDSMTGGAGRAESGGG